MESVQKVNIKDLEIPKNLINPPLQSGKLACEWGIFAFFCQRVYVFAQTHKWHPLKEGESC